MDEKSAFGERLKELLFEKGIKEKECAAALNVSLSTVYRWKKGDGGVSFSGLLAIAKLMDCSLDFLLGGARETRDTRPCLCGRGLT